MRVNPFHNVRRPVGVVALVLAAAAGSACQGPGSIPPAAARVPRDMVSTRALARQLNLKVSRDSQYVALLEDERNHLLILGPPNASVTLNGQPVGEWRVVAANNTLYVWRSLVERIKPLLIDEPRPTAAAPRPGPRRTRRLTATVILDAGHGGKDTGAPNRYGKDEKHITLDTTLRLAKLLGARGVKVVLTRRTDTYPTLEQRIDLANRVRPHLFVSIHADSAPNRQARGFTVYAAREASAKSVAAAVSVARSLKSAGVISRGVRRADFRVLAQTNCPAVLVELGYVTNFVDARDLAKPTHRQKLAQAVADGVVAALRSP